MDKRLNQKSIQQMAQNIELQLNSGKSNQDKNLSESKRTDSILSKIPKESVKSRHEKHFWVEFKMKFNSKLLTRTIQSFCVLIVIVAALFYILFLRNQIELAISLPIALIMALVVAIAFGFSLAVRCVMVLCATMITSQQGRIILLSVITSMLVGGPLVSIMYNTNQASVTISCLADLSEDYGNTLIATYKEAYNDVSETMKDNIRVWTEVANGIQTALNPIRSGFESAEQQFQTIKEKLESAGSECQNGMDNVYKNCNRGAGEAETQCRNVLSKLDVPRDFFTKPLDEVEKGVCSIFRCNRRKRGITDFCSLINIGSKVCEPFNRVAVCRVLDVPKMTFDTALPSIIGLCSQFAELFNFQLKLKESASSKSEFSANGTMIKQKILQEFEENYAGILYAINIIRILLILPILIAPISMGLYLQKYLKLKRSGQSKQLSKFLKIKKRQDNRQLIFHLVQLVSHILFSLSVICFDFALFWIEDVVKKHGNATFSAEGSVQIDFDTEGGPTLKPFIDLFVKTFTFQRTQNFTINTDRCLPEPMNASGLNTIVPIVLIYIFAIIFVFTEFYVTSLRPKIINYIYSIEEQAVSGCRDKLDQENNKVLIKNKK